MARICPYCGATMRGSACGNSMCSKGKSYGPAGRTAKTNSSKNATIARLALGLLTASSLGLLVYFLWMEFESSGLSIAAALILVVGLSTLVALSQTSSDGITRNGKIISDAAWIFACAGTAYLWSVFPDWLIIVVPWLLLHLLLVIFAVHPAPVTSPGRGDETALEDPSLAKKMRISYAIASLASLAFITWFYLADHDHRALVLVVTVIGIPLLTTAWAYWHVRASEIAGETNAGGLLGATFALAGAVFIALFLPSWAIVAGCWFLLHLPIVVNVVRSWVTRRSLV